mgnify:CR=1 FL=1
MGKRGERERGGGRAGHAAVHPSDPGVRGASTFDGAGDVRAADHRALRVDQRRGNAEQNLLLVFGG